MTESFNEKRDLLGHMRSNEKLMQLCFRACQTFRDKDHLESIMDRRIGIMEHMVVGHMVGTIWIEMTWD